MKMCIGMVLTAIVGLGGCAVTPTTAPDEQSELRAAESISQTELFGDLIGKWSGTSRTWFEPGKLADESAITGEFVPVLDGRFIRHTYAGTIRGKSRNGEELLAFNAVTKSFEMTWVDDFHMNYAIMFSYGNSTARGFSVRGDYDVGENEPKWGWRTEYELIDTNHLLITAYNIFPDGKEVKAIETRYRRVE